MKKEQLKTWLDERVAFYNRPAFIETDPISIPHLFQTKQDIEIAGFFAAVFAWGNRTTILKKSRQLMQAMRMQPHAFVLDHSKKELHALMQFKHRTFNADDLLYFIDWLHHYYRENDSLETAFFPKPGMSVEEGLNRFKQSFFSKEHLKRTEKHIASPDQQSACKRLNMYLRWMVRNDQMGVDFGIWKAAEPSALICPLDVHVSRVAHRLGLLDRKQTDWQAAVALTKRLRTFDKEDPVKYDFALFGTGVTEQRF
jgi:uncharacterized protein (TIGR02757 family)